jgi:hypothetical protein
MKQFPTFYQTQKFITMFTGVHHWSLSWAQWIHSTYDVHISLWPL